MRAAPCRLMKGSVKLMITGKQLQYLKSLINSGEEGKFYTWNSWRRLRKEVLAFDRFECQDCKKRGRYSPAVCVHHIKHLRDRPDLALSIWDHETGERQLVSLCRHCHELRHPESLRQYGWAVIKIPVTQERWD